MSKFRSRRGGGGGPDYAAIARQQEAERVRLQGIRDEEFRVKGIKDYIDYMYDNPMNVSQRSATGSFYQAISPGRVPTPLLDTYGQNRSITLDIIKANEGQYFKNRPSVPSIKSGRIRFGKRAEKPAPGPGTLLGGADVEKKQLLGG